MAFFPNGFTVKFDDLLKSVDVPFDFGVALLNMREGLCVTRRAWIDDPNSPKWVRVFEMEDHSEVLVACIENQSGFDTSSVPLGLTQQDILARDWEPVQ